MENSEEIYINSESSIQNSSTNIPDEELDELEDEEFTYYTQRCAKSPAHNLINQYLERSSSKEIV